MKKLYFFLFTCIFLFFASSAEAQIVTYSFTGANGDETTFPADAQPTNGNASSMSRGSGITSYPLSHVFNAYDWPTGGYSNIDYYEFSISPDCNYSITLTEILLNESYLDIDADDSYSWEIRSSLDNFSTTIDQVFTVNAENSTDPGSSLNNSIDLTGGDFASLTQEVTFRIYAYSAQRTGMEWSIDNVRINGSLNLLTDIHTVNFENNLCGYTTVNEDRDNDNEYFRRFNKDDVGDNHSFENSVSGVEGNYYWAVEFTNSLVGTPGEVILSEVDVAVYNNLQVKILLAAPGAGYDDVDYIRVQYSFDAGNNYNIIGAFYGHGESTFSQDDDLDGDPDGLNYLNSALTEYTFDIPKSGTDLIIRVIAHSTTTGEEFIFDNIRISGVSDVTDPVVAAPDNDPETLKGGTTSTSTVESSEYGNIYLFLASETAPISQAEIDALVTANKAFLGKEDAVGGTDYTVSPNSSLEDGLYNIVAVDYAGNVSSPVAGWLTVDNTAPTNQNTVFVASEVEQGGTSISIVSSGDADNEVWFAPAATTTFTAGTDMTKATNGTSTSIPAPADEGTYYLYIIDEAGNISDASTASLIVDNTAPTNQNTVFAASEVEQGGTSISIVSSGDADNEVWFAPAATTTFTAGTDMTKATDGTSTSIPAPADEGTYYLYIIDEAGNISNASTASLIVDNTAPRITSVLRQNPTTNPTNLDALVWDVTFDESINDIDVNDFSVSGTNAVITGLTNPAGNTFRISVSGGNLASLNGLVTLSFNNVLEDITDPAGNNFSNYTPTGTNDNTFEVDNTSPQATVTISDAIIYTGDSEQIVTVVYNEPMNTGSNPSISFVGSSNFSSMSDGSWSTTTTWTETFKHNLTEEETNIVARVTAGGVTDLAGNSDTGDDSGNFDIDTKRPVISSAKLFINAGAIAAGNGNHEVIQMQVSEPITLSNNDAVTFNNSATAGFVVDDGNIGSTGTIYRNDGTYTRIIQLESSGNNSGWVLSPSTTLVSYVAGGNIFDAAGNELQVFSNMAVVNGNTTPPVVTGNIILSPRGYQTDVVVFNLDEELDLVEGASVDGFISSTGSVASGTYTSKGVNNTITLTSTGAYDWDESTTFSYDQSSGNILNLGSIEMAAGAIANPVVYETVKPTVSVLAIASNNANTALAKDGNKVTISFTADDGIDVSSISLTNIKSGGNALADQTFTAAEILNSFNYTVEFNINNSDTDGDISFSLTFTDIAGNTVVGGPITAVIGNTSKVTVDNTHPTVQSIARAESDNNSTNDLNFTVTFNEAVTGVSNTDFVITQTNLTGTPSVSLSGSGTTYTVTVNGFDLDDNSLSGALRLDFTGSVLDAASNVPAPGYSYTTAGETYSIIHPEPAASVPTFIVTASDNSTISIEWTESATPQLPNRYLILAKKSGDNFSTVADGTFISDGIQIVEGDIAYNATRGTTTHTFTGLASGTDYDFIIYPHTNDGTNVNYRTASPTTVSGSTTTAALSTLAAAAGIEPWTISSMFNDEVDVDSINFDFTIQDDGGTPAADDADITISDIIITQGFFNEIDDWTTVLDATSAELSDGVNTIAGTVSEDKITFENIPNEAGQLGNIADNASKIYTLKVWLKSSIPDGIDNAQFDFEIISDNISYTDEDASSTLIAAQSVASGDDNNIIDVEATQLEWTTQPATTIGVEANFTTAPVVTAQDANGNRDEDFESLLTSITNTGGLAMNNSPATTLPPDNFEMGIFTFPNNFSYAGAGDGTLKLSAGGLTTDDSNGIIVSYSNGTTITAGASVEPTTLPSTQNETGLTVADYSFDFVVQDDATATVDDKIPTQITQIVISAEAGTDIISTNWSDIIEVAKLHQGTTWIDAADAQITSNTITFNLPTAFGNISDDGSKTFRFYITFKNPVTGGLDNTIDNKFLNFKITDAQITTSSVSSTIASTQEVTSGATNNKIDVDATQLQYEVQPSNTFVNEIMATVTIEANDANGNRDLDYTGAVTITSSGTLSGTVAATLSTGAGDASNITHSVIEDNITLKATEDVATLATSSVESNAFDILAGIDESDIVVTAYDPVDNIQYIDHTGAIVGGSDPKVFEIEIRDGGTDGIDTDVLQTNITNLSFTIVNSQHLKSIALYNNSNIKLAEAAAAGTIVFDLSTSPVIVPDDDKVILYLKTTFQTTVTDNDQIAFTVSGAVANAAGSTFESPDGAPTSGSAATSPTIGDDNRIEVDATELVFENIPNATLNTPLAIQVRAKDANGNLDSDFVEAITGYSNTSTSPGGALATINDPVNGELFINGIYDFPSNADPGLSFQFTEPGTGIIITLETTNLNDADAGVSNSFDILASEESFIEYISDGGDIDYINYPPVADLTDANSYKVAEFKLNDGNPVLYGNDVDGAPTVIDEITITISNHINLDKVGIYNTAGVQFGTDQAAGATVTFAGVGFSAADNATSNFSVKASFKDDADINDNDAIDITITNVQTAAGSGFEDASGGAPNGTGGFIVAETPAGNNKIEVEASAYELLTDAPLTATAGKAVLNSGDPIQLEAEDGNGNIDYDYSAGGDNAPSSITVTNSDGLTMVDVPTVADNISNGIITFPTTFRYTDGPGVGTLTITDGTISVNSGIVDVNSSLIFAENTSGIEAGPLTSGATDQAVLGFEIAGVGASTISSINLDVNEAITGKVLNVRLVESVDDTFTAADLTTGVVGTYTITGEPLTLSGLSINLHNETRYFYIVVDVEINVNATNTVALEFNLNESLISYAGTDTDLDAFDIDSPSFTFEDSISPEANTADSDIALITDVNTGDPVVITFEFNEQMDQLIIPDINFPVGSENPLTDESLTLDASSSWFDGDTYKAVFIIADKNLSMPDIDIEISAAKDITGNILVTKTFSNVFSIDMKNTDATSVEANSSNPDDQALIVDATTTFTLEIEFPEAMDPTSTPVISFNTTDEDPAATLSAPNGSWSAGNTIYTTSYTVSDGNETIDFIDVVVTAARDAAGNTMNSTEFTDVFSIDNENADLNPIITSAKTISDGEIGVNSFEIYITYDEDMDITSTPTVAFPIESPSNTITQNISSGWSNNRLFVAKYDVADANERVTNIDVQVFGAKDANGNTQKDLTQTNRFHIDTENPEVITPTGVTASIAKISDVDEGTGTFTITVDFNEDMIDDGTIDPTISFPVENPTTPAASATLIFNSGSWNTSTQYVATYNVVDNDLTLPNIDIDIHFAQDTVGNVLVASTSYDDVFSIDMENPLVASVTGELITINTVTSTIINDEHVSTLGTYELTITFNEDMVSDGSANPQISYPVDISGSLTSIHSEIWDDPQTFRIIYNLADDGALLENIDPKIEDAIDVIGNTLVSFTATDIFTVHTDNPEVADVEASTGLVGDPNSGTATFNLKVTFAEPMLRVNHDPVLTLSPDPSAVLMFNYSQWDPTGTIYTAYYDVDGSDPIEISDISVQVQNARDSIANNLLIDSTFENVFSINTDNPTITSVTAANASGFYNEGEQIKIWVLFDKDIYVNIDNGSPTLGLNVGIDAIYSRFNGDTIEFIYNVPANHNAEYLDYATVNSLTLNGATIRDIVDNDANLTLPTIDGGNSLSQKEIVIDSDFPELIAGNPFTPAFDAHNVPLGLTFTIDFDEMVIGGNQGKVIKVINANDPTDVISLDMDALLGIDPFSALTQASFTIAGLSESTEYYVEIENGAITDRAGNNYTGFNDPSVWFFTTFGAPVVSGVSDTSPCIGEEIQVTGQFFTGISEIRMNGSTGDVVTNFTVVDDDNILLFVPKGALPGPLYLRKENSVVNPSGTYANEDTREYTTAQNLTVGPRAATISRIGNENICDEGSSATTRTAIKIDVSGGSGVYTVEYTDGFQTDPITTTNTYTSGTSLFHPNEQDELAYEYDRDNVFTLLSVRDANGCYVPGSEDLVGTPLGSAIVDNTNYYDSLKGQAVVRLYEQSNVSISTDTLLCVLNTNQIQLNGLVSGSVTTGYWQTISQTALSDSTDLNATYTIQLIDAVNGFVNFNLVSDRPSDLDNPCESVVETVSVKFTETSIANAGDDRDICYSDTSVPLNGIVSAGATKGKWSVISDAVVKGSFAADDTVLTNTYIPSEEEISTVGFVKLRLETTNSECPVGTEAFDEMNVEFGPNPDLTFLNNGTNNLLEICAGSTLLEYSVSGVDDDASSFVWQISDDSVKIRAGKNTNTIYVDVLDRSKLLDTTKISVYDNIKGSHCTSDTIEFDLNIHKVASPAFDPLTNFSIGISAEPQELKGLPSPGIFSGTGVVKTGDNKFYFNPRSADAGNHPVTYTVQNEFNCTADTTRLFTVLNVDASIVNVNTNETLISEFCEYEDVVTIGLDESAINFFQNSSIVFSRFILVDGNNNEVDGAIINMPGENVFNTDATAIFDPVIASDNGRLTGAKAIRIMRLNEAGDEVVFGSQNIIINPRPTLSINSLSQTIFCSNNSPIDLTRDITQNPGTEYSFSVDSDTTDIITIVNGVYRFNPGNVPFNENNYDKKSINIIYEYTQSYSEINKCSNSIEVPIEVSQQPVTPDVADLYICQDDLVPSFVVNNAIDGATFRWNNANGVAIAGQQSFSYIPGINNSIVTSTNYSVIQTKVPGCSSEANTISIEVLERPSALLTLSDYTLCIDDEPAIVTVTPLFENSEFMVSQFQGAIEGLDSLNNSLVFNPVQAVGIPDTLTAPLGLSLIYSYSLLHTTSEGTLSCSSENVKEIVVNPLPVVDITTEDQIICADVALVELDGMFDNNGGIFSGIGVQGQNINQSFNPRDPAVIPGNTYPINYSYTDPITQCSNEDNISIHINRLPAVDFSFNSVCVDHEVAFTDETPSDTPGENPVEWVWNFGDINVTAALNTSTLQNPTHKYSETGTVNVQLIVTSEDGCKNDTIKQNIVVNPIPTIAFNRDYIVAQSPTKFWPLPNGISPSVGAIESIIYNFGSDEIVQSSNFSDTIAHTFNEPGYKVVSARIKSLVGCESTTTDSTLFIVPSLEVSSAKLFSFETSNEDWLPVGSTEDQNIQNALWARGLPEGTSINTTPGFSNINVWMTGLDTEPLASEVKAYLYSPAFDISNLSRPMISFDINYNTDVTSEGGDNGLVLQYSLGGKSVDDENEDTWQTLGNIGEGENWYNKVPLDATPGNQSIGWSGNSQGWKSARLAITLEDIPADRRDTVIFRFAFATDNGVDNDGVAMDNFFIGERTRSVLIEHFTNTSTDQRIINDQEKFNELSDGSTEGVEIVKISYHAPYPESDRLNSTSTGAVGSRLLYYNVANIPTTVLDGIHSNNNNDITTSDDVDAPFEDWVAQQFSRRTLQNAQANIAISIELNGSSISVSPTIDPLVDIEDSSSVVVHVAVVEKNILRDVLDLGNGYADHFEYVMRKLLPDARGTHFPKLEADQTYTFTEEWIPEGVINVEDLAVVVFIQGAQSKEVYQAAFKDETELTIENVTDMDKEVKGEGIFIYPVPASDQVTLQSANSWANNQIVKIFDHSGKLVIISNWEFNKPKLEVRTDRLPAGVYYIQIEDLKEGLHTRKKIMIIHN